MRQNETNLKPAQLSVMKHLIAGQSVTDAAKAAKVSRSTVFRWLKTDFVFRAELNRSRQDLRESIDRTLLSLASRAAQTVSAAIDAGDVSASLKVLRGVGALSGQPPVIGSDDAEVLREEDAIARESEQSERTLRGILASSGF